MLRESFCPALSSGQVLIIEENRLRAIGLRSVRSSVSSIHADFPRITITITKPNGPINRVRVHVFPHWNWPERRGEEINVWVHSNCEEVQLWLNDKSLGRKRVEPNSHLEWMVKYEPGTLIARGYRNSKEVVADKIETTGEPARVVLSADRREINADGEDVSVLRVEVEDSDGRIVPTANNLIKFEVSGDAKIIGVGNGDPSSHEADKANQRSAFNGLCMAIVQAGMHPEDIAITATSEGLNKGIFKLHTKPAMFPAVVTEK